MSPLNALAAVLGGFLLLSAVAVASPSAAPPADLGGAPTVEAPRTDLAGKPTRDGGSRDDEDLAPADLR
jgi:hypothetical protein